MARSRSATGPTSRPPPCCWPWVWESPSWPCGGGGNTRSPTGMPATSTASGPRPKLTRVLGLLGCRFEYGVAGLGQPARLRDDGGVEWNRRELDVDREGLPVDTDIELLVESGGRLQGRFLLRAGPGQHPTLAQRLVAVTLAAQVGAALR